MEAAKRRSAQAVVLCIALMLFWMTCVGTFEKDELLLGIPAAFLSTAFSFYAIRRLPIRFRPSLTNLLEAWRLPAYVAKDLVVVLWVLARDLAGWRAPSLFRSAPWRANSKSPGDLARRALAVAYSTVSPNCVVIGIDRERGQMLFHQIQASPVPAMTQRLGAGAGR
jgi:multisubunit Na+/H+ antiporter MnhE subunit